MPKPYYTSIERMSNQRPYYGIQLLDDIHTYFPDILYNSNRFVNVQSLLQYIQTQTRNRFDLFSSALQQNRVVNTPPLRVMRVPVTPNPNATNYTTIIQEDYLQGNELNTFLTSLLRLGAAGNNSFMDPVTVAPSAEHIENTTQLRAVTAQDETARCTICQDTFTSGQGIRLIRHCNHEFHRGCIDTWFQSNVHCPICRWDIRDDMETET